MIHPSISRRNHKRLRKAFTLIEMLVVIAIIGILASLLMPSLQSALDSAETTTCSNNLRQTSIGFTMYEENFDNFFPVDTCNSTAEPWVLLIADYLGMDSTHAYTYRPLYMCPSKSNSNPAKSSDWKYWCSNYSMHRALMNKMRLTHIRHPSKVLLNSDYYSLGKREHIPGLVNTATGGL